MTPNYAIYRRSYLSCLEVARTFDYLPDADEQYPFIYIQKVPTGSENETKDLTGIATQTIKLFATRSQLDTADHKVARLRNLLLEQSEAFEYKLSRPSVEITPMDANDPGQQVTQYIIRYETRYSKRRDR